MRNRAVQPAVLILIQGVMFIQCSGEKGIMLTFLLSHCLLLRDSICRMSFLGLFGDNDLYTEHKTREAQLR